MKVGTALPILLTSASVMLSGLGLALSEHARAQETPTITPPGGVVPRVGTPRAPGGGRPRIAPPPVPATPPTPTTPAGVDSKIQPFQSGIDDEFHPTPPRAQVQFNLEDADLPDLVRLVSQITGKRFILPAKARSIKATIYSPTEVTAAEAYQAFLSILSLNGMTLEPSGRYYKVIEAAGAHPGFPLYNDGDAMPGDDRYVTRMHRLSNVSSEDVATLLNGFKTEAGTITAYAPTNTLIITDTANAVQRMLRIVSEIDIPRTGEQIWIEPVHYASAEEMAETLSNIFPPENDGAGGNATKAPARPNVPRPGKAPVTRETPGEAENAGGGGGGRAGEARVRAIIPDERSNNLVIVATERAYLRILEVMRVLDQPVEGEGGVHIYHLQYADAEEMAETLSSLVEGGQSSGGQGGGAGAPRRRPQPTADPAAASANQLASSLTGEVAIQAHTGSNSLLITASATDYAALRRVLERLDAVPRQVFIEAVVMELSVQRTTKLGLNYHGGLPEPTANGSNGLSVLGFGATTSLGFPASAITNQDLLSGLALGVAGPQITNIAGTGLSIPSFGVVLSALSSSGDVDILSTPHLIALDNTEAEINVGQNIPLQTNSGLTGGLGGALGGLGGALGGLAGQGGAAGALGAIGGLSSLGAMGGMGMMGAGGRQSVGTIIRITPHINDASEIRMEIEEEISDPGPAQGTLGAVPINQRIAKTQLLVRDQQTVVIGGLIRDEIRVSETKVPILGDIPILGQLFRTQSRSTQKNNLLLFLTPYVIRTPDDLRAIFERKMRERQEFVDRFFVFGEHDYEPPLDYSRTRGLLGEIFLELADLDEERSLLEELRGREPPEHRARPPLGSADATGQGGDLVIGPEGDEAPAQPTPVVGTAVEVTPPQP